MKSNKAVLAEAISNYKKLLNELYGSNPVIEPRLNILDRLDYKIRNLSVFVTKTELRQNIEREDMMLLLCAIESSIIDHIKYEDIVDLRSFGAVSSILKDILWQQK